MIFSKKKFFAILLHQSTVLWNKILFNLIFMSIMIHNNINVVSVVVISFGNNSMERLFLWVNLNNVMIRII